MDYEHHITVTLRALWRAYRLETGSFLLPVPLPHLPSKILLKPLNIADDMLDVFQFHLIIILTSRVPHRT